MTGGFLLGSFWLAPKVYPIGEPRSLIRYSRYFTFSTVFSHPTPPYLSQDHGNSQRADFVVRNVPRTFEVPGTSGVVPEIKKVPGTFEVPGTLVREQLLFGLISPDLVQNLPVSIAHQKTWRDPKVCGIALQDGLKVSDGYR